MASLPDDMDAGLQIPHRPVVGGPIRFGAFGPNSPSTFCYRMGELPNPDSSAKQGPLGGLKGLVDLDICR